MKIAINKCYGGFGLSSEGIKRLAELQGRKCFFFENMKCGGKYTPVDPSSKTGFQSMMLTAFDIENPNDVPNPSVHLLTPYPQDRTDPLLLQVIEELGKKAGGTCAQLQIIEIPDEVDWEIEEYDGMEWVSEKHQTWS